MDRYTMLGKLLEKILGLPYDFLGSLWDLVEKLGGRDGKVWFEELNHHLRKEPTWIKRLLKPVRTVDLPTINEFRVDDYINSGTIDGVKVVFGGNLKKVFGGRVENDIPAETLQVYVLTENSLDDPIIATLGGYEFATVKLAQVVKFMRQQGRLKKTAWFVFYVENDEGKPWAVICGWSASGGFWSVGADSASFPDGWGAGGFFVSRDSDPECP